jgi:2-iminobutanoate/2-iminopropanoate deaminase
MKVIRTEKAPAAIGPYSQALDLGNMVFLSGQIPIEPNSGQMPEGIREQTLQSLSNVKAVLEEAGLTLSNVVKSTVFLADLSDFAAMNEVYESFFKEPYPARSCVQVAAIPKGAKVEIECIAVR